jgi:glycosyltransferase involved in cell wall biosynthesis
MTRHDRRERIVSVGLDPQRPVVIFSGKLIPRKRPLDVVRAIEQCAAKINLLILGDGPLRAEIRKFEARLPIRCLGFVNQADLPGWYACGDVLVLPSESEPWGLVVNEGMACGLVPVVSDAVGCAPDLVQGVGEVFPAGDIDSLAQCLLRVSKSAGGRADLIRRRLDQFTIAQTASGYERATLALHRRHRR